MEIVRGKKTKCTLVSILGEGTRVSLQQGLDFSPVTTEEQIPEFDNDEPALIVTSLDKFDAALTYLESDDKTIAAVLMGLATNSAVVPINVAKFKDVAWYANIKGEDGKIFRSFCAKPGTVKDAPVSIVVDGNKNAKKLTLSHPQIYDIFGAAVQHDKFISTDFTLDTLRYGATLSQTAASLPAGTIGDDARMDLFVRKNGELADAGLFSIGGLSAVNTLLTELRADYIAHCALVGAPACHTAPDATNNNPIAIASGSLADLILFANSLKAKYNAHDTETGASHIAAGPALQVAAPDATDLTTLVSLSSNIKAEYELHRVHITIHTTADAANVITAPVANKLDIGTVAPLATDIWEVFYCYVPA